MSVKSIQVKLVIPRSQRGEAIRRAAGTTHLIHNAGVRYFMEQLLCLRQEDVYEDHESGKPTKRADEFQKELIEIARSAQKRNGILNKGTDEEILKLLREVYKQVVPASIGEKGDGIKGVGVIDRSVNSRSRGRHNHHWGFVSAGGSPVGISAEF